MNALIDLFYVYLQNFDQNNICSIAYKIYESNSCHCVDLNEDPFILTILPHIIIASPLLLLTLHKT